MDPSKDASFIGHIPYKYSDSSYVHTSTNIGKLVGVVPSHSVDFSGLDVDKKEDFIYRAKLINALGAVEPGVKLTQFQEYYCDFAAHIVWRINKSYEQPQQDGKFVQDKLKVERFLQQLHDIFLECADAEIVEELFCAHAPFPLYEQDLDMLSVVIKRLYEKKQQHRSSSSVLVNASSRAEDETPDDQLIQSLLEDIVGPISSLSSTGKGRRRRRRKNKGNFKTQSTSSKTKSKTSKKTSRVATTGEPRNKKDGLEEKEEIPLCAICLDVRADITLHPCLHTEFCNKCITAWNATDKHSVIVDGIKQISCPYCRTPIKVAYPIVKKVAPSEGGFEFKYKKI